MEEYQDDVLLYFNSLYQKEIQEDLEIEIEKKEHPNYPIIVITCMDHNIDLSRIFRLHQNDIIVLRNAGNIITDDMIRSILIAVHKHNIKEIIIMGHTNCELKEVNPLKMIKTMPSKVLREIGARGVNVSQETIKFFHIFVDEFRNVKNQVNYLKNMEILPLKVKIKGYLHDDESGWIFNLENEKVKEIESITEFRKMLPDLKYDKVVKMNQIFKKEENKVEAQSEVKIEKESGRTVKPSKNLDSEPADSKSVLQKNGEDPLKDLELNLPFPKSSLNISIPKLRIPKINVPKIKIYTPGKKTEKEEV
ncbi:MAG: carbonic anhydrase [Candidatus Lokiarchaeota archaeon]